MRRALAIRLVSGTLFLVLGTLGTGLPSHHHGGALDDVTEITAADHHDHGVILTEQDSRLPSPLAALVIPARTVALRSAAIIAAPEARPLDQVLPRERPPPSASPRAPPVPS